MVEDHGCRPGEWPGQHGQPIVSDGPRGAGGLEGRAHRVIGGQAQPALLLCSERRRRCHGAAPMLARDARAPPTTVDGSEIRADARQGPRLRWLDAERRAVLATVAREARSLEGVT